MAVGGRTLVRLTANFERNLADIEVFLDEVDAPRAYDALLDELLDSVIPNLERFPEMGRPFLGHAIGSVEAANAREDLVRKASAMALAADALREYVLEHYLVLYALIDGAVHLLAIRHHRQLSFDLASHWR